MKTMVLDIRQAADAEGDFSTVDLFEDHAAQCEKELWFLSAMIK